MPSPETNDMERRDATLSMEKANVLSLVLMAVVIFVAGLPYVGIWGLEALVTALDQTTGLLLFLPLLIVGIIIHEGIHALSWKVLGGVSWEHIKFGVKKMTPYTHCTTTLPLMAYRWGTALPGLILGVLPLIAGLLWGSGQLFIWGIVFTSAASGDAMVLWLLRDAPSGALVRDHPSEVGCQLLIPADSA
ncbi:MAG: hypothetical protein GVY30_10960 [Chloroflexi bacterium]|nr:hypothetical protein [Chloroflexota bacterium]